MSKCKRTSAESSNDKQTSEDSDSPLQQGNDAKRVKLASLSYTTLQDLPMELIECILVKVVAMEVKDMKLAKSVWKEKVDLVTSRLRNVCSQWSSILTTNSFRNEVNRQLDSSCPQTIRLKILQQSLIPFIVSKVTTLKDDIFILTKQDGQEDNILVFERNSLGGEEDVIALPGRRPTNIAACSVSNCVYVVAENKERQCPSVLRVTKDEHQFNISPWISDLRPSVSTISVTPNGSLIIVSQEQRKRVAPAVVSIYNANGSLQHEIMLSPDNIDCVFQKPNGNLVLSSMTTNLNRILKEIDMEGRIQRQSQSAFGLFSVPNVADSYCRMLIVDEYDRIDLLDSEFNPMDFTGPRKRLVDGINLRSPNELHYNCERNELLYTYYERFTKCSVLTFFRFTEG